jgi:hypothetical protein
MSATPTGADATCSTTVFPEAISAPIAAMNAIIASRPFAH